MREVLAMGLQFYEQLIAALSSAAPTSAHHDAPLQTAVATAARWWPGDAETAAACVETCLDALAHVDANANLTTLAEWWLDELSQTACSRMVKVT
jgi:hypothetical protein